MKTTTKTQGTIGNAQTHSESEADGILELGTDCLNLVAGGIGAWNTLVYAPKIIPPNPCISALEQVTLNR